MKEFDAIIFGADQMASYGVEALLDDALGNTEWRAMFGIPEPSSELSRAIYFISQAVRAVLPLNGNMAFEVRFSCLEDRPVEDALDRLACQVLRSTLEYVRTR